MDYAGCSGSPPHVLLIALASSISRFSCFVFEWVSDCMTCVEAGVLAMYAVYSVLEHPARIMPQKL